LPPGPKEISAWHSLGRRDAHLSWTSCSM